MNDRYEIAEKLGEDILGSVHLADDTMLQRRVMVRFIEHGDGGASKNRGDEWRKEFAAYTGKMSTMQHPNLLTIYDVNVNDEGATVVNQFVEGESLGDRLERGPIRQLGVYKMANDMLEALHAAHESNVFHGALHTGSIRRVHRASGGHRSLLVDLGLNQLATMIRADDVQVADPVLMAPELHDESNQPDAKADLFMLGQLCYTALVGGHPFSDKTAEECLEEYQSGGMPHINTYLEDINPEFAEWIMSMVSFDRDQRPKDAGDAMASLAAVQLNEPEPNVPGETHAVEGVVDGIPAQDGMGPDTVSVHIAAANSAANSEHALTQAQMINAASHERESREKKTIMIVIGALALALIFGGIILLVNSGGDDASSNNDKSESSGVFALKLGEAELVHTVAEEGNPKRIPLDDINILDWLVCDNVPISSEYLSKEGGYFQGVQSINVREEKHMLFNPIRFQLGDRVITPRSSITKGFGAKIGSGYEIQLRAPNKNAKSFTVDVYIVQKDCNIRVEISDASGGSAQFLNIPEIERGVVKVPVFIDNPKEGEFFTIKVLITEITGIGGKVQLGLPGAIVNQR